MDIKLLLKKLLPGLAPLIIFIIADSVWGTKVGLIVAILFGVAEAAISLIKGQKPDKFILFDIGLLVVMGLISLVLHNDVFFKLKPAIIGGLLSCLLGVSAYGRQNIVMLMAGRYIKGMEINDWQQFEMVRSLKLMFWLVLLHTVLVFVAALYLSNAVWVSVSGPGFYVLFGVFFVMEMIKKRIQNKKYGREEWLPIVNENGDLKGKFPRSVAHNGSKILHPVVHLQVFNAKGELYLQKRAEYKLVEPGKWDTAVGGHVAAGESIQLSLQREASEEIGLKRFSAQPFQQYVWESEMEREMVYAYITTTNEVLVPCPDEVSEGKFWSLNEIDSQLHSGVFTPNFIHEYQLLQAYLQK